MSNIPKELSPSQLTEISQRESALLRTLADTYAKDLQGQLACAKTVYEFEGLFSRFFYNRMSTGLARDLREVDSEIVEMIETWDSKNAVENTSEVR